jgi:4-amino-4-deoxy-L-arabinose transferase-like glycosyltransferase
VSAPRRELLFLAVGSAVLFGLRIGARDLWNPNEPIYGEAVREMAQRGEWLLPYVNGVVFAEKPILFYWLALVASKLLGGVSELSLRLPSFFAAIATVLGTYVVARPYAGRPRALLSAVFCATLFGVFWNARFVQMDILVTAETLWVVIAVTRVVDHGGARLRGWLLAGAIAGLGFAAKGPVAWICPGFALLGYLIATRRLRELARWEVLAGMAACVAVASPWYVLLLKEGRADVVVEAVFRQNVERFVNPWDHEAPFWYYLQYFWIDMAPWAFLVPLAIGLPRSDFRERRLALLSWIWIATIMVFFSLSRSKRSPYILPIAPAVALLSAEVALAFVAGRLGRTRRAWFLGIVSALAGGLALGGVTLLVGALRRVQDAGAFPVAFLGLAALVAGAFLAFDLLRERTRVAAPFSLAVATVVVFLAAGGVMLPSLDAYKSARPVCDQVARLVRPGDDVVSYSFWRWRAEYSYYLGRPITNLTDPEALRVAWGGSRRVVCFVEASRLESARQVIGNAVPDLTGRVGRGTIYVFTNRQPSASSPDEPAARAIAKAETR